MKKTILLFLFFLLLFTSCKNQSGVLNINQVSQNSNEIVIRYSEKMKTFWVINIPFQFEISNNSDETEKFVTCSYIYNNQLGRHSKLYIDEGRALIRNNQNDIKTIESGQKKTYVIYSQHIIDTIKYNKTFFKSYLDKVKGRNEDTLLVGTLEQFKSKHPQLVKSLIEGDSLNFEFLTSENKFKKPIKIPLN